MCEELRALGVAEAAIEGVLAAVAITDVAQLEALLGADNEVCVAVDAWRYPLLSIQKLLTHRV